MGKKADIRAARLAAALDREWWAVASRCWVYVYVAVRWWTDPEYREELRAERANKLRMSALLGAVCALGTGASDEWQFRQTLTDLQNDDDKDGGPRNSGDSRSNGDSQSSVDSQNGCNESLFYRQLESAAKELVRQMRL